MTGRKLWEFWTVPRPGEKFNETWGAGWKDRSGANMWAFAATVGMTPFRYVMTRRLARARELLERTGRSALDIALDVGFKTPSHFAFRFRREFGVTPRAIRRDARRLDARLTLE